MKGERVSVRLSRAVKFGVVVGESKDRLCWHVLIDGNRQTSCVGKDRVTKLPDGHIAKKGPI